MELLYSLKLETPRRQATKPPPDVLDITQDRFSEPKTEVTIPYAVTKLVTSGREKQTLARSEVWGFFVGRG